MGMTFDELQTILTPKDGRLRLDPNVGGASLPSSLTSLFREYFGGVFDVALSVNPAKQRFHYAGQDRDAIHATGTLRSPFLGCTVDGVTVDAKFFLLNEAAQVVTTLTDLGSHSWTLASLSSQARKPTVQGEGAEREVALFRQCVFTLDSNRPYSLDKDFDTLFPPAEAASRNKEQSAQQTALRLTTQVQLEDIDEMLADVLGKEKELTVAGPVVLVEGRPRMRLATDDPGLQPQIPMVTFPFPDPMPKPEIHYHILAKPSASGTIVIREQLNATFTHHGVSIPLRATFEPNSLTQSLTIESFDKKSALTFNMLASLISPEIVKAVPQGIPVLDDLKLTNMSFEVSTAPLELSAVGVRVEVSKDEGWPVVPDLLIFKGLALDLSMLHDAEGWEVGPFYITGTLDLAGGTLDVGVDVGAETVCCLLRQDSKISLKNLFETLGQKLGVLPSNLPQGEGDVAIDHLEIWASLDGSMVTFDIGTQINWGLLNNKITINSLFFSLEYEKEGDDTALSVTLAGSLTIAGVTIEMVGRSSDGGWAFQGRTGPSQKIPIGTLIDQGVKLFDNNAALPPALKGFTVENLGVSFNTGTKSFAFTCQGNIPLGDGSPVLACTVDINIDGTTNKATFGGTLTVGGAEFALQFESAQEQKELRATWQYQKGRPRLDLKAVGEGRLDLSALGDHLIPTSASLILTIAESDTRLSLACTIDQVQAVFLLISRKKPPATIVAFGLKPPKLSTKELGPLGKALDPRHIALKDLVILAANETPTPGASGSDLKLGEKPYPISKGLFLQGALEFEQTSFSYPFECRLGGEKPKEQAEEQAKALSENGADEGSSSTTSRASEPDTTSSATVDTASEREEGGNNVKVGRTIGPVTFRKVRFESREESGQKRVYVLLDASLGSGGFELDLQGFNLNFPLTLPLELVKDPGKLTEIRPGLDGLSIAYSNPPLTVCGGFARTKAEAPYVDYLYEGNLLIKAEVFQIAVVGSYGTIQVEKEKRPSLFLYGAFVGVVGGPPAFFVTGLALGGGYNTRLALPPVDQVAKFPLVTAVTDPTKFDMATLRNAVLPSSGDYWLAIGVKFTSFKMADSFALFSVAFGNRLQFALLGLTKLTLPTGAEAGNCAVYAELQIRAVLDPEAGVFSIEGRLTDNSFVFDTRIRLTGGFAFFVWFGKAKEAGDFVISLGGYHPEFRLPSHYPLVPRVGIRAQLSTALTIVGEAYLAITPSCLMTGLKLAVVFESGNLTAAFLAYADFLIAWAPFSYDARVGMGIAVTYRSFRTFKLEVAASLHIWGPPFAGTATVTLWIVSFTVEFGDSKGARPPELKWIDFQKAFLPPPAENGTRVPAPVYYAVLNTIRITEGLVREVKKKDKQGGEVTYRIANPHELMIETDSVVPCTEINLGGRKGPGTSSLGIRPMVATSLTSVHTVSLKTSAGAKVEEKFTAVQWLRKNFPEALWSPNAASGKPEAEMLKDVPSGVVLRVQPMTPVHRLGPFGIAQFAYEDIPPKSIPWGTAPTRPDAIGATFETVAVMNEFRNQIRKCLVQRVARQRITKPGQSWWNEIAITKPSEQFQAPPTCAALGQGL